MPIPEAAIERGGCPGTQKCTGAVAPSSGFLTDLSPKRVADRETINLRCSYLGAITNLGGGTV